MKVVFCGSSIPKATVKEICPDALVLPPAEQGDVDFAFHQLGASVIGLIDGVHTQKLSVFHKEILQVLEQGGRIFGAASMGALRAVECEPWGAEPIGEIAKWYREGIIDADEEVALAHGDESTGYRQLSIPLVNIRASLRASKLDEQRQDEIIAAARGLFYPERHWQRILEIAEVRKEEARQIAEGEVDLKLADAIHLCHFVASPPARREPERRSKHAVTGYGGVFRANDRKIFSNMHTVRLHEIADVSPQIKHLAACRKLAIEFARMAGIKPKTLTPLVDGIAAGLSEEETKRLTEEQNILALAAQWLSSSRASFGDVQDINDWLRVSGLYQTRLSTITGGGH
jgi:hypothetical protein